MLKAIGVNSALLSSKWVSETVDITTKPENYKFKRDFPQRNFVSPDSSDYLRAVAMEKLQTALHMRQSFSSLRVTNQREREFKNAILMVSDRHVAEVKKEVDLLRNRCEPTSR